MSHGMKIMNGSGTFIVDSTDDYGHFFQVGSGTVTGSSFEYPSGVDYGDLFFVKLPGTGFIAEQNYISGTRYVMSTYTASKPWIKVDTIKNNISSSDLYGDYGLNIFESTKSNFNIVVKSAGNVGVNITNAGSGYTSAPTVSFSAPTSGTTATGTAAVSGGAITSITITNPGSGYSSAPSVSFSGGGGSGAAATASLATAGDVFLSEIVVADAGSGFVVDRVITIPDHTVGNGGAADFTFVVASKDSNGAITGLKTLSQTPANRTPGTYNGVVPNYPSDVGRVVFSTRISTNVDIISVGSFADVGTNTSINIAINDTGNYYVLIPGTTYASYSGWPLGTTQVEVGYQYNYSGTTTTLNSIDIYRSINGTAYTTTGNQAYMIIKLRS
jgi:hypothetical protein